jgi:predicted HD phosphohydrolase
MSTETSTETSIETSTERTATFRDLKQSTKQDWEILADRGRPFTDELPSRVIAHLNLLADDSGGYQVTRLTHSLQTAARAERAGRDDEYVLAALMHDIGDTLGSYNHADLAAAILQPFVRPELHWMVQQHAEFQGYYFFHHVGLDRDLRDRHAGHPQWDLTAEFCADFDAPAFDPDYHTPPLAHYEPLVRQLMARPRRSIYLPDAAGGL